MGDLNFRLEVDPTDLSPEEIASLVSRQEFGQLLAKDQLTIARTDGEAFSELNETLPTFPPSYKYKIGTSDYDLKAGVKHPHQYISQDKHGFSWEIYRYRGPDTSHQNIREPQPGLTGSCLRPMWQIMTITL